MQGVMRVLLSRLQRSHSRCLVAWRSQMLQAKLLAETQLRAALDEAALEERELQRWLAGNDGAWRLYSMLRGWLLQGVGRRLQRWQRRATSSLLIRSSLSTASQLAQRSAALLRCLAVLQRGRAWARLAVLQWHSALQHAARLHSAMQRCLALWSARRCSALAEAKIAEIWEGCRVATVAERSLEQLEAEGAALREAALSAQAIAARAHVLRMSIGWWLMVAQAGAVREWRWRANTQLAREVAEAAEEEALTRELAISTMAEELAASVQQEAAMQACTRLLS